MMHPTFSEGKLASSQQEATHIVVSNSPDATVEDFDQKQHLVSGEVVIVRLLFA